jgi:hypothetical protein
VPLQAPTASLIFKLVEDKYGRYENEIPGTRIIFDPVKYTNFKQGCGSAWVSIRIRMTKN